MWLGSSGKIPSSSLGKYAIISNPFDLGFAWSFISAPFILALPCSLLRLKPSFSGSVDSCPCSPQGLDASGSHLEAFVEETEEIDEL